MPKKAYKPSGTLKKFLDVKKTNTRLVGSVERFLLSRPKDTSRRSDVIHPSAMVKSDWCHRGQYYELLGNPPAPSKYKASLKQQLVFSEGHRIHDQWQDWIGQMGNLYGLWECDNCGDKVMSTGYEKCENGCGGSYLIYKEVPVQDPELRIQGHADGLVVGLDEPFLLEIKSVGVGSFRWEDPSTFFEHDGDFDKMWAELKSPFYTHIMQTQVYMKLLEGSQYAPEEVVILYEAKPTQEVKEFVIKKSDFGVTELFDAARMIVAAVDKGIPPMCNIGGAAGCHSCNHHEKDNDERSDS